MLSFFVDATNVANDNIRKLGLLNFLKDVRIFHGLDEEHISMILNFSETEFLVPGHEGNLGGNALYIVRNGECYCDDGFDMKVGDIFGQITIREQDFFSDKVEFKLYDSNRVQAKNAVVELISIGQVFFRRVESLDKRFFNIDKTNCIHSRIWEDYIYSISFKHFTIKVFIECTA